MLVQRKILSDESLQRVEENESLQKKSEPIQRVEEEELQKKAATDSPAQLKEQSSGKPNNTGLPDNLKSGIESLSGMSMDSVRVHYNSAQPAQLNALAYAQGTDIHVAPGQEQHLPHEAWHVVQQAQGRVQPTMQMKEGIPINDDRGLEHEADVMGAKAMAGGVMQKLEGESAQLKSFGFLSGASMRVSQLSAVEEYGVNDDENLTQDKKIKTKNGSTSWFRFPKDGNKIDTFANNETKSTPKGAGHVGSTVNLDDDAKINQYDIGWLTRPQHFAAGDRLAKIDQSYRKSKWTWHHKQGPYYMELVDMAVHKSFYHHGGFSKWQEGTDDDNDE
ncbi:MAG: DUF4157 domain-containing protein [Nitrosomonas sp.]|nr:MAG: DUF4157 domain-containing protein [Nitrosomonas sp.]